MADPARSRRIGVYLTLAGAVMFSMKAVFIKLAYAYEVTPISLLGLRMAFSLPFFIGIGLYQMRFTTPQRPMGPRAVLLTGAIGLLGYYVASYTDFLGLQYVTAGMERIILFVYPTLVLIGQRLLFRTATSRTQWIATGLSYVGIVIAFSEGDLSVGSELWKGGALVFVSAVTYAGYVIGSGRMTPIYGTVRFTTLAMVVAGVGVLTQVYLSGDALLGLPTPVYAWAAVIAVVCTVVPTYLVADGIKRAGAGDAAIIGAVGPVCTIALEYWLLPDRLSVVQMLGGALVIAGVVLAARAKPKAVVDRALAAAPA